MKLTVNSKQRPVNLDLRTIKLPITAYTSILHRISGVVLFFGFAVLLYMLSMSLASEQSFDTLKTCMGHPLSKLVAWLILSGLIYHVCAGIRHLIMDLGFGETLEGGRLGAKAVIIVAVILVVLAGVWIW